MSGRQAEAARIFIILVSLIEGDLRDIHNAGDLLFSFAVFAAFPLLFAAVVRCQSFHNSAATAAIFVSIAQLRLSPGPERYLRTDKGQKTTLKLFSVSFFSFPDAARWA